MPDNLGAARDAGPSGQRPGRMSRAAAPGANTAGAGCWVATGAGCWVGTGTGAAAAGGVAPAVGAAHRSSRTGAAWVAGAPVQSNDEPNTAGCPTAPGAWPGAATDA